MMSFVIRTRWLFCAGVVALLLAAQSAWATGTPATANIIEVTATSAGHSDTFVDVFPVASFDGLVQWGLGLPAPWGVPAPLVLKATDGTELARFDDLGVTLAADPQADLRFAVRNSSLVDEVYVDIKTVILRFSAQPNAQAKATASLTVTDGAGSPAGAYLHSAGTFPNAKLYQARYSTDPVLWTNTVFASLVSAFDTDFGVSWTERRPATGFSNLGTTVYAYQTEFEFILSAGDQASGTSAFVITPEPASACLLALAGMLAIGRLHRGRRR